MSRTDASRKEADSRTLTSLLTAWAWKHQIAWLMAAALVVVAVLQFRQVDRAPQAKADTSKATRPANHKAEQGKLPSAGPPQHDVMAMVNGQEISRDDLISACVRRFGEDVLESIVNKRLILNHCEKRGIQITQGDIAAEIDRMASRFKLGREEWLEMLERERGIGAQEYARDIVWPTLALRKLAAEKIQPTREEVDKAIEREFGEAVRARLIALNDADLAKKIQSELVANPESFARAAIEHSVDVNSASVGGLIQPIRHHVGDPTIEKVAFSLRPGEVSPVIGVANQYVILKCEEHVPARPYDRAEVEAKLVENIKDEKLRTAAHELFAKLQEPATILNVYNDPQLRETMPGVVATVNGDRITMQELGQECILRHGEEVLETEISHLLLKQALKKAQLTISDEDLMEEVRHAAELAGVVDEAGNADLEKWYQAMTTEQGIERQQYMEDSVWPSAALKKLTAHEVDVTDEDMKKGFEANYGQRVRCRAIVLGNMRRAQEVWDKARQNPSVEYFGDLASEYSIEPTSKALRGEVPPLQRFGGQPQLEEAAFQLQPGQLSGIIQVGDKFIILRCEGRTEQMDIDQSEVAEILHRDIYEKKLRLAMGAKYEEIRETSRIDNFLAGTSHAPPKAKGTDGLRRDTAVRPTAAQR